MLAKARVSKRRLLAFGLSDHYVEIFEITRLSDFIGVFPDEQSAISRDISVMTERETDGIRSCMVLCTPYAASMREQGR